LLPEKSAAIAANIAELAANLRHRLFYSIKPTSYTCTIQWIWLFACNKQTVLYTFMFYDHSKSKGHNKTSRFLIKCVIMDGQINSKSQKNSLWHHKKSVHVVTQTWKSTAKKWTI